MSFVREELAGIVRWPQRLPAHVLNGLAAALGVLMVQLLTGAAGGTAAAAVAAGGAIYASLADTPNPPHRTWRRVAVAAAAGLLCSVLVTALRGHALALGVLIVLLAFAGSMVLAWGVRAGPISFVPILAIVFTMASPAPSSWRAELEHALWTAAGGVLYLLWALLASHLLRRRYRALALAGTLQATAALFRSRAAMLATEGRTAQAPLPLQDWMQRQVTLDERLQGARDLLFAETEAAGAPRQIAVLVNAIAMRDTLLGSELDLDLLGEDRASERLRKALAARIVASADMLERMALAVQFALPLARLPAAGAASAAAAEGLAQALAAFAADPQRHALVQALGDRVRHLDDDLTRMLQALEGPAAPLPVAASELQLFVSPEGWPLAALAPHRRLASPILRQAIRSAVALGTAYYLALMLPWASHPHWLVLSVAVVLRGNLDQTLARRNARVAGTVIGCLLVLVFAWLGQFWLSGAVFVLSVGVSHAFVNVRYLFAATGATITALLQAHMAHPTGGFAISERLADTVLGALLAWAFCYVLPAWERGQLRRLLDRVQRAARTLAAEALRWPEPGQSDVALRLARREFYEAIGSIAASAQRSQAEPLRVQLPVPTMATLLARCHVLLAQLSAVRTLLERRRERLQAAAARQVLAEAAAAIDAQLLGSGAAPLPRIGQLETNAPNVMPWPPDEHEVLLPWLQRRVGLAIQSAHRVAEAAEAVRASGAQAAASAPARSTRPSS